MLLRGRQLCHIFSGLLETWQLSSLSFSLLVFTIAFSFVPSLENQVDFQPLAQELKRDFAEGVSQLSRLEESCTTWWSRIQLEELGPALTSSGYQSGKDPSSIFSFWKVLLFGESRLLLEVKTMLAISSELNVWAVSQVAHPHISRLFLGSHLDLFW